MISISEDFYSIQGEGATTGVPSYFIRLPGCNLLCGNPEGGLKGDITKPGENATWICDSIAQWVQKSEKDIDYLIQRWIDQGILDEVLEGIIHLIWTGGEPTNPANSNNIANFLDHLHAKYDRLNDPISVYNEIETNGTNYIHDNVFPKIHQINCSVKLANSGMPKHRRIKEMALERIMSHQNYWFKFVVTENSDMDEIYEDFVLPFNIPKKRIILMPGLDNQDNYHEAMAFTMELAKKHRVIGLGRNHVSAWNKLTGV